MGNHFLVGIGINKYEDYPLRGCVNDVSDFMDYCIEEKEFKKGNDIRLLVDKRATKKAILERLDWLVEKANIGDICVFQYSGHGTNIPNRNEDYEVDKLDEVIVPVDFSWDGVWITDDILGEYADKIYLRGALPIFVMDSCSSGTILRGFGMPKFIPQPVDIRARITPDIKKKTITSQMNDNAILISGCQDDESSEDASFDSPLGTRYNGALTYCLLELLKKENKITWGGIKKQLPELMEGKGYDQHPTIYCKEDLLDRIAFE